MDRRGWEQSEAAIEGERDRAVEAERAACAELVREAGCSCLSLNCGDAEFGGGFDDNGRLTEHDPRCPIALAAAIEARGAA